VPGKGRKELWGPAAGLPACAARTPPLGGWVGKFFVCCFSYCKGMAGSYCCAVDTSAPGMPRRIPYYEPAQTTHRSLIFYHI
jgi:hypothetical protein